MKQFRDSHAAFIAPLSAPLFMFVALLVTGTPVLSSALTSLFTALISYFGFVLFILPLHKYLKAKNKESVPALMVAGLIGGALIVSVLYIILATVLGSRESLDLKATSIGALFGGGVAIVFCLLSGIKKLLP